jgi:hypothetical protein
MFQVAVIQFPCRFPYLNSSELGPIAVKATNIYFFQVIDQN